MAAKRREASPVEGSDEATKITRRPPAKTLEGRENQMVALAMDVVEQRLRDGTATSQEVTHFLKLGSTREKMEQERIKAELQLSQKKIEQLQSTARIEELYADAIKAMTAYAGRGEHLEADPYEED